MMGSRSDTGDLQPYEGLIYSTAARYAPYLDDDMEDIQQLLRIKVWQALVAFDRTRWRLPGGEADARKRYVFSCVSNRVKDMLKAQYRRNDARGGAQLYTEDVAASSPDRFELLYLRLDVEVAYAAAEDDGLRLPSTLNEFEVRVVHLLLLDLSQAEAARVLGVTRGKVRTAHAAVKIKMADWAPGPTMPVALAA